MNKKIKKRKIIAAILILFIFFLWLNNTSLFSSHENIGYKFLAHRGLAQVFDETNTDWNNNTVAMIEMPTHDYIENTIPSMQAAFDLGASDV